MRPWTYLFPGSFCPPTYGHMYTLNKAIELFGEVTVVCSVNPKKTNKWFSPDEGVAMWRQAFHLPQTTVTTIDRIKQIHLDLSRVVIIRGVRDAVHFQEEGEVVFLNFQQRKIDKYLHIVSDDAHNWISSSRVRQLAEELNLAELPKYVPPLVVSRLLERVLELKRIYMVVGKPGAGKSTFLRAVHQACPNCWHIETDSFSQALRPLLVRHFGTENLFQLAVDDDKRLTEVIADDWLRLLAQSLQRVPVGSTVFVEIPYGLMPDKRLYRFVGGQVIYLQGGVDKAEEEAICWQRLQQRGTPDLKPFIERIPDFKQSQLFAQRERLQLSQFMLPRELSGIPRAVEQFISHFGQGR